MTGYPSGPNATVVATASALTRAENAQSIMLVEGVSDQIAVETLAKRLGRDLTANGIVVVPVGGAQAISKFLDQFNQRNDGVRVCGLCDDGEVEDLCRGLVRVGLDEARDRNDLERHGFFVCVKDLEDELIRAVGPAKIEDVLAAENEVGSFRTFQKQAAWSDAPFDAQMRRFLGARSGRKHRYAQLLVQALDLKQIPKPLTAVLERAGLSPEPS